MINAYQKKIIAGLIKDKREFIKKQLTVFDDWMEGDMFMPCDGRCYHCNGDVISEEIKKGNDGSESVTGCRLCNKSFCD